MRDHLATIVTAWPTRQRVFLVIILFITLLFSFLDRINMSVLLADATFLSDLGIKNDTVKMGLLMSVFLIIYAASNIVLSPSGDLLGPRKAILICLPIWAAAMLCSSFATTFARMLFSRGMLGLGEGMHYPVQMKCVKNWFSPPERGKANSVWQFGLFVGPAFAVPFFAWQVDRSGWRMSFTILAAATIIPFLLVWYFTADHPRDHKWDSQFELGHVEAGLRRELEAEANLTTASFGETLRSFIFNYRYLLLLACFFFNAAVWWGIMTWLPAYPEVARGFSWSQMGALASLPYIFGGICLVIFGCFTDKAGRRAPFCAIAVIGMAVALYLAAHATDNCSSAYLIAIAVGFDAVGLSATWSLCQQLVPTRALGTGAGLMNGIGSIGGALWPIIIGYFIGADGGSYVGGLMCLVVSSIAGALCMLALAFKKY
jgi:sugar phosphate permease